MGATLHQTLLMVTDLDASLAFYRDVLGLEPSEVNDDNVEFATGDCTLVLEEDFDEAVLDDFGLTFPADPRGEGVIAAIGVDDREAVADTLDRVREGDQSVLMDAREVPWGRVMSLVEDPDGYTIEVSAPA